MLMPTTTRGDRALRATIAHQDFMQIPLCATFDNLSSDINIIRFLQVSGPSLVCR